MKQPYVFSMKTLKPKKRSTARILAGKVFYSLVTYIYWFSIYLKLTKEKQKELLPFSVFQHKTPLYRKLSGVDMIYQENKVINLSLAIKKLDRVIIKPGEVFSYWVLIGRLSRRKGYTYGIELFNGTFRPGIGGGLCQLSNLLFWIFSHSDLTLTKRYRHSYDVWADSGRTQPFGSGATCFYPFMDLEVRNDTSQTFQLHLNLDEVFLHGELFSDKEVQHEFAILERDHHFVCQPWGKYTRHNKLYQIKKEKGKENILQEKLLAENNAICMYEPFLEESKNYESNT